MACTWSLEEGSNPGWVLGATKVALQKWVLKKQNLSLWMHSIEFQKCGAASWGYLPCPGTLTNGLGKPASENSGCQ